MSSAKAGGKAAAAQERIKAAKGVAKSQSASGAPGAQSLAAGSQAATSQRGGAGGDAGGLDAETAAVAKRHQLQLQELLYLLQHKVGTSQDFMKHKLTKALDSQLRALVNGRLKDDFDELHKYLDARELAVATDIFSWRKVFFPQIMASIKALEEEQEKDRELIQRAELALEQGNAFLLESTGVQKLMALMQAAVKRDSVVKTRALEAQINLSEHEVYGLASCKRAVDRLHVARSPASAAESAARSSFHVTVQATAADLKPRRLHWVAAYGTTYRLLLDRWVSKFADRMEVSVDVELDGLLRELVDGMVADPTLVEDLVTKLFLKYDSSLPAASRRKLQDEVGDAARAVFQAAQAQLQAVVDSLKARMDYEGQQRVSRAAAAAAWATYWEKELEAAVSTMVAERQPRPIALTAPADQKPAAGEGEEEAETVLEDKTGVARPIYMSEA